MSSKPDAQLATILSGNIADLFDESATDRKSILMNRPLLRILTREVHSRATVYDEAAILFADLSQDKKVVVLVDFDVIYAYIESESMRDDYGEIRHFFECSDFNYGMPVGAYEELLSYLRSSCLAGNRARQLLGLLEEFLNGNAVSEASREDISLRLSAAFNVLSFNEPTEGGGGEGSSLDGQIDNRIVVLSRLISVLSSPRFQRVYSAYEQWLQRHVFDLMQDRESNQTRSRKYRVPDEQNRSGNDMRDARNLSVVCRPYCQRADISDEAKADCGSGKDPRAGDGDGCSPMTIVPTRSAFPGINKPKLAASDSETPSDDEGSLAKEYRESHYILLTSTAGVLNAAKRLLKGGISDGFDIAVKPSQLVVPALLGAASNHVSARDRARAVSNVYMKANQQLEEISRCVQRDSRVSPATVKEFLHVIERVRGDSSFQRIEDARSTHISGPYFLTLQRSSTNSPHVHPRYTSFARLSERLYAVLSGIDGYDYRITGGSKSAFGYHSFAIAPVSPAESKCVSPSERVEEGFDDRIVGVGIVDIPNSHVTKVHVQWDVDVDEVALMQCLADERCPMRVLLSTEPGPSDTLSVVAGGVRYEIGPSEVEGAGGLRGLTLAKLQSTIRSSGQARSSSDPIEEIEFRFKCCQLVFDIVPPEFALMRRLTVIGDTAMRSEFIRHLYEWTGSRVLSPRAFERTLQRVLNEWRQLGNG